MDVFRDLAPLLVDLPFLRGLKPRHIDLLVGCASNVAFKPDDLLFKEGDEANTFFIIRAGNVALELSAPGRGLITVQTCGDGETVGWSWLVGSHRWQYSGRALAATRAIAFDGKCLRTKCDEDPELGYELLKRISVVLADRLHATQLQLLDRYSEK